MFRKNNSYIGCHRYPRTTQELRANQDRNDPYVRGARRNLPSSYDDLMVGTGRIVKSWKKLTRRRHQYVQDRPKNWEWREYSYSLGCHEQYVVSRNLIKQLKAHGCRYEYVDGRQWTFSKEIVLRWYGPDLLWQK